MDFELKALSPVQASQLAVDALVVLVPDDTQGMDGADALSELVRDASRRGDLETGVGKCLSVYRPQGLKPVRVVLARTGDCSPAAVRKAVTAAMSGLKSSSVKKVAVLLSGMASDQPTVHSAMVAVADSTYAYVTTKPSATARAIRQVIVGVSDVAVARPAFRFGLAQVAGIELAKEWANRPANHATPSHLAEAARKLGRKPRIRTEVLGPKEVAALGMGAFMAVAQGSSQPLRFIVMHYQGGSKGSAPVVLVGKGITFDTGGICLKPAANMHAMKGDMSGAAAVLATLVACAGDELPRRVVGIMACAENMPGGNAMRPGDVVRAASGDTVEIQNTDAEGRLALCDALDYAQKQWTPAAVVDIATLTGACAVALGTQVAGLFCDDDALAEHIRAAGAVGGENYWPLPLWKGYEDNLKSEVADICHMGPREGGAIHAALFLKHFVREGVRWAHLDIAGVDWATKKTALCPVGSTGFGARTLLELARGGV